LKKKFIVQATRLRENDIEGYVAAHGLKDDQVTLAEIEGAGHNYEDDDISDESLNEFWHKEASELEKERQN